MSEYTTLYQFAGSLFGLFLATFLYMLGGRSRKWQRRFIASLILAITVNVVSLLRGIWNPYLLIIWPLLIGGFSLGYGADTFFEKVLRRTIYALGVIFSGCLFFTVTNNAVWVLIPHVGIGAWSIYMGVRNPIESASEEGVICVLLNIMLISYPFIGGLN